MGQITKDFAEQMLVHCARGEHPPLTVWEAEQLARFAMQAITTAPQAQLAEVAAPSVEAAHEMGAVGAPGNEAERLAFEAWMRGHCWALCATWDGKGYRSDAEQGGEVDYKAMATRRLWASWRDRAALSQQVAPQAQQATYHLSPAEQSVMSAALRKSVVSVEAQQAGSQAATLTYEEIADMLQDHARDSKEMHEFARAIIAALQAKEGQS